jgi:phosphatidylinositol-3-phosphatase
VKAAALIALLVAVLACTAAAAAPRVPSFDHVIVVMFENKEASSVIGSSVAPTFNLYARRYASLTQYHGVTHPSLPNYIALVSGSTYGIKDDCTECVVSAKSLVDGLEAAGRSWKTYAEGLPSPGFLGPSAPGGYAKKHNPFVYFRNVISSPKRLARIVPLPQLAADLRAKKLPDFSLVVPNLCNSMHDCSVAVGDAWLRKTVGPLLNLPKTVIFVLFDEGSSNLKGGGHTAALAVGTAIRPHSRYTRTAGHYAALRTIEDAWGLPRLGQSAGARPITGTWR